MLNRIIQFSIRNKLIIGLFILALVAWGSYQFTLLPIDAVPDITDNQVQVITVTPALGAPDVERLITFPIEQANSNIPGLKEIRSFSRFGLSLVTIVFSDNTDVYWARQQVSERLQQVQASLPKDVGTPELAPVTTGLGEIYQYVVKPKPGYENRYDTRMLRSIQDWIIRRQLLGTPGVADVSSFGGVLKQYEVAVNPAKLKAFNVTLPALFDALQQNNQNTGGAYIEKGPTALFIRSEGLAGSIEDIANIVVKTSEKGLPVLVRDVATVKIGGANRYGAMCYNDQGEVAGAVVMMLKGGNSSAVIKEVKKKVAAISKTLPEGVEIKPFLDRSKMVNHAISTVKKNLMEGALIVVLVLVFFLGNFRAGLIVASVIPLSMLFAVILMNAFGVSGNLMSLGALDFGLIVDGAVIIVEAVLHKLTQGRDYAGVQRVDQQHMDNEVSTAASRMMNAAVFGQVIILVVYLPILTLRGIEGKMFRPMAQTVSFAVLGAFFLSLTYVPMMSALCINKKISHKQTLADRMMAWLEKAYGRMLQRVIHFRKTMILTCLVLLACAVWLLSTMGGEFIPQLEEGDFAVDTRVLTGSSLHTTINSTQQAASVLLKHFPEVQQVVTKIGSGEIPTDPMPIEASDMMVILKDKKEWTSAKSFDELAEKMGEQMATVPGITTGFQYPVQMRFNELMTGARQDVVCKIFGENLDSLAIYAEKLGALSSTIRGAKSLYVEKVTGMPQIVVKYKRPLIAQYGLNIATVNQVLNTAFAGQSTGYVFEGEQRYDLVVRMDSSLRTQAEDVRQLLIPAPNGQQLPLGLLADIEVVDGPNQIQREDAKRRIIVGFNVRGRDVQSVVEELQAKAGRQLHLPPGYFITYGGAFENLAAAKARLGIAVPVALLLIFLLLYFAFGSIRQGLLVYSAIPLSAIGGVLALWVRGMPFSISAGIGFIALFGVAVLNSIVLISHFNRLRKDGMEDMMEIISQGTKDRLRPVLMTAMVASLGFLPMALSTGAGAEVQRPLATVVIGGLVTSTILTLLVLPSLYLMFGKGRSSKGGGVAAVVILLLVSGTPAFAQQRIPLPAALDMAAKHNYALQGKSLQTQQQQALQRSGFDPSKAMLGAEYGQMNSIANDTRIGITQTISFPSVYTSQRKALQENYRAAMADRQWSEREIQIAVKQSYYQLLWLYEKERLLHYADSIYALYVNKVELGLKLGENNIVETTAARQQSSQVKHQLQQLQPDIQIALQQFNFLLGEVTVQYAPEPAPLQYTPVLSADTSWIAQHPLLQRQQHLTQAGAHLYQKEKRKQLPDLMLGYSNQSIIGYQRENGAETYYGGGKRFSAVQAGVGIPLFNSGNRALIKASALNYQQLKIAEEATRVQLQNSYASALANYRKQADNLRYYRDTALAQSQQLLDAAAQQIANGNIGFLEWVLLVNQGIGVQNDYLNAEDNYNQAAFQLEKITGTN
ncbi:CusA/CzcA family heavy metal efflux RND transporter [Chitinophaga vietnamensis]|uniref:CusA/CzcA family heavy metal efflux RND transporter n=1 Tax=Chitinophaga vietnamensis TaxID=2593957 RepID=UPI0011775779|nr:CusA/CzcA family heavy metal efflux RND transporter [Chitinophaga vietnamensis]